MSDIEHTNEIFENGNQLDRLIVEGKVRITLHRGGGNKDHGKRVGLTISIETDDPTQLFAFEKLLGEHLEFDSGFQLPGGPDGPPGQRDWSIPLRNKKGKRSRR